VKFLPKTWICFATVVAIIIGVANRPVEARDRPGAPHQVDILDCGIFGHGDTICGAFQIDLTDNPPFDVEKARIEVNLTENGVPIDVPSHFACFHIKHVGQLPSYPSSPPQLHQAPFQCGSYPVGNGQAEFLLVGLKFGANYCISLRSRRVSDNVVSANWSNPVCLRTRAMPSIPSKPDITLGFYTSSGGDTGPAGLRRVDVEHPNLLNGETASVAFNGRKDVTSLYDGLKHNYNWVYTVDPSAPNPGGHNWLEIKVCKSNFVGETCATKTIDLNTQKDVPIKVTGAGSGGANRFPASSFPGDWTVTSSNMGSFELDMVQLTGSALFGEITNGSTLDKGTVRGTQSDSSHAQLTLKQPGLNRTGTVNITVISDGNSFIASGTLSNGQTFTWQGTKKHPVSH
jgi:hypothetical protein